TRRQPAAGDRRRADASKFPNKNTSRTARTFPIDGATLPSPRTNDAPPAASLKLFPRDATAIASSAKGGPFLSDQGALTRRPIARLMSAYPRQRRRSGHGPTSPMGNLRTHAWQQCPHHAL